ncbi:SNO glutamine amidotransferase [Terriglobus saanensis SP1PR4]|uniref:Pyridoxal 5'-phosphate synthase subunit PdxT n=2 Tax=Terriglobus saanensis TaxID=870903 RepID=E8V6P0_TERSS|nr:SNO glutamine amidotransferase [Terriglobus saanensis SP1PR4]
MTGTGKKTIGVLALQGAFDAHAQVLRELGADVVMVRKPEQLEGLDGLVIPGGESTTFLWHLEHRGFFEALKKFAAEKPAFGTCAGAILMAKDVRNPSQKSLAVMDIAIERNAYGRQNDSRILKAETTLAGGPMEMVYIRAPRIAFVGNDVEVLANRDGDPVLVRQGDMLAATFHPELSEDRRVHEEFLKIVDEAKAR